jgi:ferric-dicitrate binding protein FerR (iron transport regulator)
MEEMDELLAKYMLGEASGEEIKVVDEWVKASDANLKYFNHFKQIWDNAATLKVESRLDEDASWAEFKQLAANPQPQAKIRRMSTGWLKIAAMLLLTIGAATVVYKMLYTYPSQMLTLQAGNVVKTDTLADGSVITLNKNSSITYPDRFTGDSREITLAKGEAFFEIAPDKTKPFLIHINDVVVKVVGTSFNIKKQDTLTKVIVETGVVQVIRKKIVIRLKPTETAEIDRRSGRITKGVAADRLYNFYRTNLLVADNTPLWRVVQILNDAYNANITIADKRIANRPISTTFIIGSLEDNLSVIRETFNLQTVRKAGKIIIK